MAEGSSMDSITRYTYEVTKDGKEILEVMQNNKGQLLREDGKLLWRNLEPLKLQGKADAAEEIARIEEKLLKTTSKTKQEKLKIQKEELELAKEAYEKEKTIFETANPNLSVDKNGIVRSKEVFKTKDGIYELDKHGNKQGCAIQKPEISGKTEKRTQEIMKEYLDGTRTPEHRPITEEMEIGINKEQNIKSIVNWIPDILLAPPRAAVTIAFIPWLLKNVFGMEKNKKVAAPNQNNNQVATTTVNNNKIAGTSLNIVSTAKKGGV